MNRPSSTMASVFNAKVANRHEERARKALAKSGLKEVTGVNRVTVKIEGQIFGMSQPTVTHLPGSDLYVVFGEAKQDSLMSRLGNRGGMDQFGGAGAMGDMMNQMNFPTSDAVEEEEDNGEPADEEGLDADEIQSIIAQTGCSRNKAVTTLRRTGTVVDAILELQ